MPRNLNESNPFTVNPDAKNKTPQRFVQSASNSKEEDYASTEHFPKETRPKPDSDYAGGYMDWDGDASDADLTAADARVRTDAQIEAAVHGALDSEVDLDASQIDVQVIKGVVLLTGNVMDEQRKFAAERRVMNIPGIREVKNQLHLNPR